MVYGDEEIGVYRDSYENGRSGRMGRSFCVGDLRLSGEIAGGEGLGIGDQGRCGANSRAPLFDLPLDVHVRREGAVQGLTYKFRVPSGSIST